MSGKNPTCCSISSCHLEVERIVNRGKGGSYGGFGNRETGGEVGFEKALQIEGEVHFKMRHHGGGEVASTIS